MTEKETATIPMKEQTMSTNYTDLAIAAGWRLDEKLGKWRHPDSSALYCDNPRWARYACEDHGLLERAMEKALALLRTLARMTTPTDPETVAEWLECNGYKSREEAEEEHGAPIEEWIIADRGSDENDDDAATLHEMIRQARSVLADTHDANPR